MTIRIRREDSEQLLDGLTSRQRQILSLIEAGKSNKDIAYELGIGIGTVKQHIAALFRRLRVTSRTMAIAALRGTRIEVDRKRTPSQEAAHFPDAENSGGAARPSATWLDVEWRPLSIVAVSLGQAERLAQMVGARRFADASARLINGVQTIVSRFGGVLRPRAGLGCEVAFGFGHNGEDAALSAVQVAFDIFKAQPRDGRDALSNIRVGVASGIALMRGQDSHQAENGWDDILQASFIDTAWSLSLMGVGGLPVACPLTMEMASSICFATSLDGSVALNSTRPVRLSPRRASVEAPPPGRTKSYERLSNCWKAILPGRIDLVVMLAPPGYGSSTMAHSLQTELEQQGVIWQEGSHSERIGKILVEVGKQAPTVLYLDGVSSLSEAAIETLLACRTETRPHEAMILISGRNIPPRLLEEARIVELTGLDDAETFLRSIDPENSISDKDIGRILAQGGNSPLVIEELVRLSRKSVTPVSGTSLTPRLLRYYLALLDLTGEDRQVLRLAALFGKGFEIEDLDLLWPHGRTVLRRSLRRLTENGHLFIKSRMDDDVYCFVDPLMQEAISLTFTKSDSEELLRRQSRAKLRVSLDSKGQLEPA
jgi:DNA-binding CsgD family transcriptional regulator